MKFHYAIFLAFTVSASVSQSFNPADAEQFQAKLNEEFRDSIKSPLSTSDRAKFHFLDFYPANAKFIVLAKLKRTKNTKPFEMKTSTARRPLYKKYGELTFKIDGVKHKLNIYQNIDLIKKEEYKNHLFLPFSDLTSGKETYIGGRYIDLEATSGKTMIIDFNKAYNPYCAYNYKYSCPVVPLENDLKVAILAGVKNFQD